MIDIMKQLPNVTYAVARDRERALILKLLKQGHKPEFSVMNNYIRLGGITFNGWGREHFEEKEK